MCTPERIIYISNFSNAIAGNLNAMLLAGTRACDIDFWPNKDTLASLSPRRACASWRGIRGSAVSVLLFRPHQLLEPRQEQLEDWRTVRLAVADRELDRRRFPFQRTADDRPGQEVLSIGRHQRQPAG